LFGFTGEQTDATGLVYLRARSLDPSTGLLLSADSVVPNSPGTQGYNLYTYVANNPTTWTDPTGHFLETPLGGPTVWDVVRYLAGAGLARVASLAVALQVLVAAHPIAALVGFAVLAGVLIYFLLIRPMQQEGLGWSDGQVDPIPGDPREAPDTHPNVPVPPVPGGPGTSLGSCDDPPEGNPPAPSDSGIRRVRHPCARD
jgi:RHS repeat-associated protein